MVTPFLPGDSLLFAAGAFAGLGGLDVGVLVPLFIVAAFLGDNVNYFIGSRIGRRAFSGELRFVKKEYLERTERFYEKHGGQHGDHGPLRPHRPDLRAVRGRHRSHDVHPVHRVTASSARCSGSGCSWWAGTCSATCRR